MSRKFDANEDVVAVVAVVLVLVIDDILMVMIDSYLDHKKVIYSSLQIL